MCRVDETVFHNLKIVRWAAQGARVTSQNLALKVWASSVSDQNAFSSLLDCTWLSVGWVVLCQYLPVKLNLVKTNCFVWWFLSKTTRKSDLTLTVCNYAFALRVLGNGASFQETVIAWWEKRPHVQTKVNVSQVGSWILPFTEMNMNKVKDTFLVYFYSDLTLWISDIHVSKNSDLQWQKSVLCIKCLFSICI